MYIKKMSTSLRDKGDKKHAYLIMAHNELYLLKKLLEMLDDERNDIYIHVDKKCKAITDKELQVTVHHSKIYFIRRKSITWGGDSQIKCEIRLLKQAHKKHYMYYHFISGVDFPLKSQDYIHNFFMCNGEKIYLDAMQNRTLVNAYVENRFRYYFLLQNKIGRNNYRYYKWQEWMISWQKRLGVDRLRNTVFVMEKGSNWFSITDEAVKVILSSSHFIRKYFYFTRCPDESCFQTILYNSYLRDKIVCDDLRCIDWDGRNESPRTYELKDYDMLTKQSALFARKFTCESEEGKILIDKLERFILSR